jgi:putative endonuclease
MQYVYVLRSEKDNDTYIGCTENLKERVKLHNAKKIASTKKRAPFVLIYYEAYLDKGDAFNRERYLKTGWGRSHIKKVLSNFFDR